MSTPDSAPLPTQRSQLLRRLADAPAFDVLVIGGGATGLGVALDAVTRGLSVALVEANDFAKGTSSRATKLVHGGVRYLAQGNVALVREALHERAALLENAPHLAQRLPFIMPSYSLWETPFYGTGLRMYDALAGRDGLGRTQCLSRQQVQTLLSNVNPQGLRGGVQYWDGQFDDARLALALARTAAAHGAQVLNYLRVVQLIHDGQGRVCGAQVEDAHTQQRFAIQARCVINATGVWVDALRQLDEAPDGAAVAPMVSPSQGTHIVVERRFWPAAHALLVPKTRDGRVLFAVPWLGSVILGTTDSPRNDVPLEPRPQAEEIGFILDEAARYLAQPPRREDIRSSWAGMRPLVRPIASGAGQTATKALSREHTIHTSASGMVTVTGGKWTTYRAMAEDVVRHCQAAGLLPVKLPTCQTRHLPLVGKPLTPVPEGSLHSAAGLTLYGSEAGSVQALPGSDRWLSPQHQLNEAMVRFAVRHEYARTVEDVLARRNRLLFLDAATAAALAPQVATIMGEELGHAVDAAAFQGLAQQYASVA